MTKSKSRISTKLGKIYRKLRDAHGHQGWWPARTPFEVAVGAVLAQNTSWKGASGAVRNLMAAGKMDPKKIHRMKNENLANYLVPAGYFNLKTRRLKSLVAFLIKRCSGDPSALAKEPLDTIRHELLSVWGVGPETADSILLYAAGHPVFVVDAYTRRIFSRLGMIDEDAKYEEMRSFFEKHVQRDVELYMDFHAQIVRLGHDTCRPKPLCRECPLRSMCSTGRKQAADPGSQKIQKQADYNGY